MNNKERKSLLKNSKPEYVLYWHRLISHTDPYLEGYIGIAKVDEYARRFSGSLINRYKGSEHFLNAIKKYGEDNIITEILIDGLSLEESNEKELIYRPNTLIGWNIRQGGGNRGRLSEESKAKISVSKKALVFPYEKIFTPETREKIRLSKIGNKNCVGKKWPPEMRKNMSEAAKKEESIRIL